MKNFLNKEIYLFTTIFLLITFNSNSQTRFIWGRQFGSEGKEYVMNHVADHKGNIYVSGTTSGKMGDIDYGNDDGFITKLDSSGNVIWTRQFGTAENEVIQWSAIDNSGNVYITGSTRGDLKGQNNGGDDIFVVKYDQEGHLIWLNQIGTDSTDIGNGIFADNKGFIYVTGITSGKLGRSLIGKTDGFILKLDNEGNLNFAHQFGTSENDQGISLTGDDNSNIYVCGTTWGDLSAKNKGFVDAFIIKITDEGNQVKSFQFGSEGFDIPMAINVDNSENIYIGGSTSGNFACSQIGEGDCFMTKFNSNVEMEWNRQFGTQKNDGIRAIEINDNLSDNLVVCGVMNLPPAQAFIKMYNKTGDTLWEKNFDSDFKNVDASGKDVTIDENGYLYTSGLTQGTLYGPLRGDSDFYILKLGLDRSYLNKLQFK
jgi:hypothetical protein